MFKVLRVLEFNGVYYVVHKGSDCWYMYTSMSNVLLGKHYNLTCLFCKSTVVVQFKSIRSMISCYSNMVQMFITTN